MPFPIHLHDQTVLALEVQFVEMLCRLGKYEPNEPTNEPDRKMTLSGSDRMHIIMAKIRVSAELRKT